jgi:aminoglycoside phosphotransferase (APT) family kinase protein
MARAEPPAAQARPSDNWVGSKRHRANVRLEVARFIKSLNLDALRQHANQIRGRDDCDIQKDKFTCGKDHIVFELTFGDTETWIARFPFRFASDSKGVTDHSIEEITSEIATLEFIKLHSHIPVPEIQGCNLHKNNKVGAMYVFMNALPGRELPDILPFIPDDVKPKVYQQVAKVMLEISQLPRWPKIGSLHMSASNFGVNSLTFGFPGLPHFEAVSSARQYYLTRAQVFLDRKISEWDPEPITLAWLYREAVSHFVNDENSLADLDGFPLWHADFSNCNILFDDDYNLTGIIDWSHSQSAPWELFACLPHEFSRRMLPDGDVCEESRRLFLSIFEEEEGKLNSKIPLTRFMWSKAGRISELVEGYQHMQTGAGTMMPWRDIQELIELIYGEGVGWEQVKQKARASLHSAEDGN